MDAPTWKSGKLIPFFSSRVLGTASRVLGTSGELSLDPRGGEGQPAVVLVGKPPVSKKPHAFVGVSLTNPRLPLFLFVFLLGCHHFLEEQRYQKCGFFLQFHSTTIEISYSKKTHDSHTKNRTHPQNKETRNQKKQWGGSLFLYICARCMWFLRWQPKSTER